MVPAPLLLSPTRVFFFSLVDFWTFICDHWFVLLSSLLLVSQFWDIIPNVPCVFPSWTLCFLVTLKFPVSCLLSPLSSALCSLLSRLLWSRSAVLPTCCLSPRYPSVCLPSPFPSPLVGVLSSPRLCSHVPVLPVFLVFPAQFGWFHYPPCLSVRVFSHNKGSAFVNPRLGLRLHTHHTACFHPPWRLDFTSLQVEKPSFFFSDW